MNKMKVESEEVEAGDPESMEKSVLLLKNGQLNDIAALHEGFNLKRMPQNYLNKRSCIEKLIFHATMSDALKSPFSGFTIANRFLRSMDSMNVISGIRSLKALAKIALPSNRRTSVMVHRIGNTWLLDEFDTDSFLLAGEQSRDWRWLRKFLIKKNIFLCAESFSRNTLILRDLYIKFLYHTVNQSPHMGLQISSDQPFDVQTLHRSLPAPSPNDSGSELDPELTERVDGSSQLTSSLGDALPKSAGYQSQMKESLKRSWTANPDEFLHTAKWQLQDLSFLVGSDLAIFGTPKHPCISLKLSPMHESINVLTGIDIWLENILNEVPEVAMCYHHEGIVMQEYELYKTCDIPAIAGFETKQIYRIVQNIIMFLKRNATQEGHTYWLVKEPECGLVKLYDLTTLCENDRFISELDQNCDDSEGINPFILPVATLCYRLAELRWNEHQLEGEAKPVRAPGTNQQTEHQADNLTDALRLARNCLNVISLAERGVAHSPSDVSSSETKQKIPSALDNLKARAILLLCRLYLATPYSLLSSCIQVLQTDIKPCFGVVSMNVEDLAKPGASESDTNQFADPGTTESVDVEDAVMIQDKTKHYNKLNRRLLGNILLDAFKASDTSRISQFASDVFHSCNPSMPIDPSKTEAETLSQCEALVHSHNSFGSSSNVLLSSAMVKVYLSKAQECWMRSQTTASTKCGQPALFASQIRVGFRYLIPSLVLLEHLIPDAYSNAFGSNILPEHPVCPYCGQPGMQFPDLKPRHAPSVDRRVLANFLRIASCLFSAAVVCYTDAVRQIDRADYMSKLRPHLQEQSDRIVLQTACSLGREQVTQMLEAVVCGPYFCKVGDEPPDDSDKCSQWLRVLHLTARCMLRVLRTKTCTSSAEQQPGGSQAASKRNKHRKQADLIPSPMHSVIQPLFDLPAVGSRLVILHDWWPVLVNMYVLSLRKRWFYEVADGQTSTTDEFLIELSQALNVIRHPALSMHQLNGKSQFVTSTNEFQLYKLAAAVSQVYPRGSWTEVFRSYPFEETPILPLAALVWTDDSQAAQSPTSANVPNKRKSEKRSRQSIRFSLTSVCLASAIESMLRHFSIMESLNSTTGEIDTQSSTCLLIAANEYIPTCMVSADSTMNPEYVNTLYTVIKQITRRLPEEFLVNPGQRVAPSTLMMSRNLIVQTVDFRLNQVRVSLLKFCQHSITDRGQSDSPMWFTIVGQARTAVEWYFARLPLPTTEEERRDPVVIKDLIACLSLVHRLIFMQVANLDVLSLSGLMNSLKDLLMTQSVIQILKDLPPDALQIEMPEPAEYHLQCLCFYLFVICHMISSKYRSKPSQRADRKSRKKAATKLDSVSVRDSPILSPEVELADRLTAGPPSILRDFQCNDVAAFVQLLKNHDLDSFGPLCRLFAAKVDLLQQHFS